MLALEARNWSYFGPILVLIVAFFISRVADVALFAAFSTVLALLTVKLTAVILPRGLIIRSIIHENV